MAFLDFLKVQKQGLEGLASVGTIGLHMVSGPLVGVVIGYFLDKWLETSPWFKLIFLFIGIAAGFLNVYLDSKLLIARMEKKAQAAVPDTGESPASQTQAARDAPARQETPHGDPGTRSEDVQR